MTRSGWVDAEHARLLLSRLALSPGDSALSRGLDNVTRIAAGALRVDRVGVWLFESDASTMHCVWQYDTRPDRPNLTEFQAAAYPTYLEALHEHRFIVADDARTNPLTKELTDSYLIPLDIVSMLDAPVYRGEELVGIVCHEHSGEPRHWTLSERHVAGSAADVVALLCEQSARFNTQAKLDETLSKLEQLALLDDLARVGVGIAHEINNVLSVVLSTCDLLELRADDPASVRKSAADLRAVGGRAAGLVRQLLTLNRSAARAPEAVDLHKLLTGLEPALRAFADGMNVAFRLEATLAFTMADARSLEQVVMNLVANARNASEVGSPITITLSSAERERDGAQGSWWVIEVVDKGRGMSKEELSQACDPFFTTRADQGGTGLGLHIVDSVVSRDHGFVEIVSEPGRGTRVRVFLPKRG